MNEMEILALFSLKDKVAIVTGASRGIGRAIAEGFLGAGAVVYFVSRSEKKLKKVKKTIKSPKARFIAADLTQKGDLDKVVNQVMQDEKRIDILVNNAGITIGEPSESYSEENWERTYQINLKAAFFLSQIVARHMINKKSGVIINITSVGAERGFPENPAYVAFKGGLKQLTKALARDWAKYNIRVNNLGPGYTKTDMTLESWNDLESRKVRSAKIMLERWGEPSDLVGPAIFLAADASRYITGEDIYVDGGLLAKGL